MSPVVWVQPKTPGLSLLLSFLIPGLGSMINGEVGKGVAILVTHFVCTVLFLLFFWLIIPVLFGFIAFGLWVYGMVDAYAGAVAFNQRHGLVR